MDSLYFSVITLATVGYGDLHPTNSLSKVFTIIYIFFGVGLVSYIVYSFSKSMLDGRDRQIKRMEELIKVSREKDKEERNMREK